MRPWIVRSLEVLCERTHWLTWRRPIIWILPPCRLALWSSDLDERWGAGVWRELRSESSASDLIPPPPTDADYPEGDDHP